MMVEHRVRNIRLKSVLLSLVMLFCSCSNTYTNRDPVGKAFPVVSATPLDGSEVVLPDAFDSEPVVAVIGYLQESQFDIDRWFLGLAQLKTPISAVEVPAVMGVIPRMLKSTINRGMKDGIPQEDWSAVYTVYEDADVLATFTGTERPRNARIVLLDDKGIVRWFSDRGYSARQVQALDTIIRENRLLNLQE